MRSGVGSSKGSGTLPARLIASVNFIRLVCCLQTVSLTSSLRDSDPSAWASDCKPAVDPRLFPDFDPFPGTLAFCPSTRFILRTRLDTSKPSATSISSRGSQRYVCPVCQTSGCFLLFHLGADSRRVHPCIASRAHFGASINSLCTRVHSTHYFGSSSAPTLLPHAAIGLFLYSHAFLSTRSRLFHWSIQA